METAAGLAEPELRRAGGVTMLPGSALTRTPGPLGFAGSMGASVCAGGEASPAGFLGPPSAALAFLSLIKRGNEEFGRSRALLCTELLTSWLAGTQ